MRIVVIMQPAGVIRRFKYDELWPLPHCVNGEKWGSSPLYWNVSSKRYWAVSSSEAMWQTFKPKYCTSMASGKAHPPPIPCFGWQMFLFYPWEPLVNIHPALPWRGESQLPNLESVHCSNWLILFSIQAEGKVYIHFNHSAVSLIY